MEKYFNVNSNGCSISCKIYADDPAGVKNVILFGHGFGGNKDNKSAEKLAKRIISKNKGAALIIFPLLFIENSFSVGKKQKGKKA